MQVHSIVKEKYHQCGSGLCLVGGVNAICHYTPTYARLLLQSVYTGTRHPDDQHTPHSCACIHALERPVVTRPLREADVKIKFTDRWFKFLTVTPIGLVSTITIVFPHTTSRGLNCRLCK